MQAYDKEAKTFSQSRKDMRWPELEYFFSQKKSLDTIVDVGCGSGRLLMRYYEFFNSYPQNYIGIDTSKGLLEEAKKYFPEKKWIHGNMLELSSYITEDVENIFCIASFHHLSSRDERIQTLTELYQTLKKGGRVYMTNWALVYGKQKEQYIGDMIRGSENDFSIKLGQSERYYHGFLLQELEELFIETGWKIIENNLFVGEKNIISILEK